ncbi:MAG: peptidylprolyl isomerase [Ilumatobacteraceae bacterium]
MATEKRERQRANRQLRYEMEVRDDKRRSRTRRAVIGVIAVVGGVALVLLLAWAVGRGGDDDTPSPVTTPPTVAPGSTPDSTTATDSTAASASTGTAAAGFAYGTGACPPAEVTEPTREFTDAPQLCIDPAATYSAEFVTDRGSIVVELDTATVPGTVNNFVTLARYGYYDDTLLFRTDTSIGIIQGGGRSNTDSPGYEIPDEADGFTYEVGQLAMARTAAPNSAGGQWFFNVTDAASALDAQGTYVVFGQVTEGLAILEEILALAGGADGQTPTEEVVLETVEISES